ncbi:MAG: sterol desaturase family protein [Pseudomonadota bacterium]
MNEALIETLTQQIDDAFFLIGGAMLLIEILKGLFSRSLKGVGALDMIASASTQIPFLVVEIFLMTFVYAFFVIVSETVVTWQFDVTWQTALLALLAADFAYYWEHRFAHRVRLFWTQHAVHHSSRYMNIVTGFRFGPFESIASAMFTLPLILIGFPPALAFSGLIIVLAYQTWIHTALIGKLPVLDEVLNTPANHRVHHGSDEKYIDKNYGGILIIWDRLFGSFQREEETPIYGLKRDFDSVNPLAVWFSELPQFFKDVASAKSVGEAMSWIFGPPEKVPAQAHGRRELEAQARYRTPQI